MSRYVYDYVEWMVLQLKPVGKEARPLWTVELPDEVVAHYQEALDAFNEEEDKIRRLLHRVEWNPDLPA